MRKGVDVSHHNGGIDWQKAKAAGIDFAMLRACYGWDNDKQIDRQLHNNVRGCEAAGVPYGLYHYSYAMNPEQAEREAAFFLRACAGMQPRYPVAFDFEEGEQLKLPLDEQLAIAEAFLGKIEAAGYYGVLYMSASPLERLRRYAPERVGRFDCWVAHVNTNKPAFAGDYGIWQYSWKGRVDGISGDVDMDYAYKDYPAIIEAAGLNGCGQAPETPPAAETVPKAKYDALLAKVAELAGELDVLAGRLRTLAAK